MCYNSLIESSVLLIPKTDIYIPLGVWLSRIHNRQIRSLSQNIKAWIWRYKMDQKIYGTAICTPLFPQIPIHRWKKWSRLPQTRVSRESVLLNILIRIIPILRKILIFPWTSLHTARNLRVLRMLLKTRFRLTSGSSLDFSLSLQNLFPIFWKKFPLISLLVPPMWCTDTILIILLIWGP